MTPTQKLVAALRSGDYTQGSGCLRKDDKFCCLGVACDLYLKEHPDSGAKWAADVIPEYRFWDGGDHHHHSRSELTTKVQEWLGWEQPTGDLFDRFEYITQIPNFPPSTVGTLMGLNDNGYSFAEIADVIERGEVKPA